jgi:hypothetical protein
MKTCCRCKEHKPYDEFYKNNHVKGGYSSKCISCEKQYQIEYRSNNENRKRKNINDIQYYHKNKEKFSQKRKEYDLKHPERQKEYNRVNLENNNLTQKKRYSCDINYKLRKLTTTRIYTLINGFTKSKKTMEILGCTAEEFKQHIESLFSPEMTWENHGDIWEIDHILPCASFDFTREGDLEKCFHYSNHQPLFKTTEIAESFGYTDQIGNRNKGKKLL